MRLVTLVVVSACMAGASSQALAQITVGPAGSGANHDQISTALAAAAPGAVLLVAAGTYEPFVVQQSVSIVGAGSDVCTIANPAGVSDSAIEVRQTAAGSTVRISGLAVGASESLEPRIAVRQCAGRVEVVDVVTSFPVWPQQANSLPPKVLVEGSAAVLFDSCELLGNAPLTWESWRSGSTGLDVAGSFVSCVRCTLAGGRGSEGYGGAGLAAHDNATVTLARTSVSGGSGGQHWGFYWWDIYGYPGSEAIDVESSLVVIAGGPGNLVVGGDGVDMSPYDATDGGAAVRLAGTATVRHASDAVLARGEHGLGGTAGAVIETFGTNSLAIAEPEERATVAVVPAAATNGSAVVVESGGRPFAAHLVVATFAGVGPLALPGAQFVHADPAASVPLTVLGLDGSGLGSLGIALPAAAPLVGLQLLLQSVDLDLSILRFSNPAQLVIR